MSKKIILAGAAAAALLLAACGSVADHHPKAIASQSAPASPSPAVTHSPAVPRLTMKQARALYLRVAYPLNALIGTEQADSKANASYWVQRSDALAVARAIRTADRLLLSARWPADVQPLITHMVRTYDRDSIRCYLAQAESGSVPAMDRVSWSRVCTREDHNTDPDQIRALLGLPPAPGS